MSMIVYDANRNRKTVPEEVASSLPKASRYMLFCETPENLQGLLDSIQYYDFKDTIVIPPTGKDDKPTVCVIVEDPDVKTRVALERLKSQTKSATHTLLKKTSAILEDWSRRLEESRREQ